MSKWKMVKLGELLVSQQKSKVKAGEGLNSAEFKFFTSSNKQSKFYTSATYKDKALIFGTGGLASIHYCETPFSTSTDCIVFYASRKNINLKFIFKFLQDNIYLLEDGFKGAGLKHISKDYILNIQIPLPPLEEQEKIAKELDKITNLIEKRKSQLEKLDLLVKAKFIEMFGDPVTNPMGWEVKKLGEIAEIKIGPFGSLLHKEDYIESNYSLVNPSHIVNDKIVVDSKLSVSYEKYNSLSSYHLKKNNIVLGRRGEMGRCAVVEEDNLLCGTGSIIIRANEKLAPYFIQKIISYPTYKKHIENFAVGITMLNLNVPIVSSFTIPLIPLNLQEKFATYVQEVEKLKTKQQQGLNQLEILYKSRMQEYFG